MTVGVENPRPPRIGLLWRGERAADPYATPGATRLAPLMAALRELGATVEPVVYEDNSPDAVRDQLLGLDGVLVWVNPIQDGASREYLDALLREVAAKGVWISAHPDVILRLGTKTVLFETRDVGWGSDTDCYRDVAEFRARFPDALVRDGVRVLKQARGNGGNGVWKVTLVEPSAGSAVPGPDALVEVQHALARGDAVPEQLRLGDFIERCSTYFAWSRCLVDQPFQPRLADGLVRCYFVQAEVVGFCHQWPKGLLDPSSDAALRPASDSVFEGPNTPAYQSLRLLAEREWVPKMQQVLDLDTEVLPAIWDADFLYGPQSEQGEDTYVLCEINVSAVWPFPVHAIEKLARVAAAHVPSREFPGSP